MKNKFATTAAVMASFAMSVGSLSAATTEEMAPESQPGFKFEFGLAYISGVNKLADKIVENNSTPTKVMEKDFVWPVGIFFEAYYDFANGLGVGANFGPMIGGYVQDNSSSGSDSYFYIIPIGLDVRYTFLEDSYVSPYVRAGIQENFVSGDYVSGSSLGFVGAVGLDFGHSKRFGWGIEAGVNTSKVRVDATPGHAAADVKPMEFTVSAFFRF